MSPRSGARLRASSRASLSHDPLQLFGASEEAADVATGSEDCPARHGSVSFGLESRDQDAPYRGASFGPAVGVVKDGQGRPGPGPRAARGSRRAAAPGRARIRAGRTTMPHATTDLAIHRVSPHLGAHVLLL